MQWKYVVDGAVWNWPRRSANIGAVVCISAGGKFRIQTNDGKASYLGHSVIPLYFGLGDSTAVEFIEVKWPHGGVQKISNPSIDKLIVITEED